MSSPEIKTEIKKPISRFKKGQSGNPGGRPPKTESERAAEEYLRAHTLGAAKRLVELQRSETEKIALGAVIAHLRIVVGELERVSGPNGERLDAGPPLTNEERRELLRVQLQNEQEKLNARNEQP